MAESRKYLYGDSKPFPLAVNFLELIEAVTGACASLMRIDVEIDQMRRTVKEAKVWADVELARLEALARTLETALHPHLEALADQGGDQSVARDTANRLVSSARATLEQAHTQVVSMRDDTVRTAENARSGVTALTALETLLVKHVLPETDWYSQWQVTGDEKAGGKVEASVGAVAPIQLYGSMEVTLPGDHFLAREVRVSSIAEGVQVHVQREARFFGSAKMVPEALDKYLITRAELHADAAVLHLYKNMKEGAPGFGFRIPIDPTQRAEMRALTWRDQVQAALEPLEEKDSAAIQRVWAEIEGPLRSLPTHRTRLIAAAFGGTAIEALERPRALVEAMVHWLAPLLREVKARSSGEGELNLKIEVDGRHREEIYILEESLVEKYASLPPDGRAVFDDFGLSVEEPATPVAMPSPEDALDAIEVSETDDPTLDRTGPITAPAPIPSLDE